ncbi:MAG: peptide chain release factor N(5)-glutamine methyltransferase [Opitutales bacterium]
MQTVMEVLNKAKTYLASKGVPQAKLDAEHLIADTLDCSRLDLYLQYDRPLDESELSVMRERVKRRSEREPLQYILGKAAFMDFFLKVDKRVLIPRPETEVLVEKIINTLTSPPKRILDLGVGSGAITIALARAYPEAELFGVDLSAEALELAKENAKACEVAERITFKQSHWMDQVRGYFDLIVSNPPYLTEEEWACAEPEVQVYEPRQALVAGEDGLSDLTQIVRLAKSCLNPGGVLVLETGIDQHAALKSLAHEFGYVRCASEKDLSERDRYFFAWA